MTSAQLSKDTLAMITNEARKESRDLRKLESLSEVFSIPELSIPEKCDQNPEATVSAFGSSSGGWLFEEPRFQTWMEGKTANDRFFWIQGRPGSGKTFLTANAVKILRGKGHAVLCAFVSHDQTPSRDPLHVLKCFTSQLFDVTRELVYDTYNICAEENGFLRDFKRTKELFCALVRLTTVSLSLVVDGLDEIEPYQRMVLLETLLAIQSECDHVRVLVSSREEQYICHLLKDKPLYVKVHEHNRGEITAYMERRKKDCIDLVKTLEADEAHCKAIGTALDNVAQKANGIFLYARLVLQLAMASGNVTSIMNKLNDPPNGLDEAYGRVLWDLKDALNAKMVLQWIACAKVPLTSNDIMRAIRVQRRILGFRHGSRMVESDLQDACGPLIENMGGRLRFTHFTAKEYLLGPESGNYLDIGHCHMQVTATLLEYMYLAPFDRPLKYMYLAPFNQPLNTVVTNQQQEPLRQFVLSGDLGLFRYAASFWLEHAKDSTQDGAVETASGKMASEKIKRLHMKAGHLRWGNGGDRDGEMSFCPKFRAFRWAPNVQRWLAQSAWFANILGHEPGMYRVAHGLEQDPTKISLERFILDQILEELIKDCHDPEHAECSCQQIRDRYGTDIFACRFVLCPPYRKGFESVSKRDKHEEAHLPEHHRRMPACPCANAPSSRFDFVKHMTESRDDDLHGPILRNWLEIRFPLWPATFLPIWPTSFIRQQLEGSIMTGTRSGAGGFLSILEMREENVDYEMLFHVAIMHQSNFPLGSVSMISTLAERFMKQKGKDHRELRDIMTKCLLLAVCLNLPEAAEDVVKRGANPNGQASCNWKFRQQYLSPKGITLPLLSTDRPDRIMYIAAQQRDTRMILRLTREWGGIIKGADLIQLINTTSWNIDKFLSFSDDSIHFSNDIDWTVMLWNSVGRKHPAAVELCLQKGADPNRVVMRAPLLYEAVEFYQLGDFDSMRIITQLIEAGADPYPELRPDQLDPFLPFLQLPGLKDLESNLGDKWHDHVNYTKSGRGFLDETKRRHGWQRGDEL